MRILQIHNAYRQRGGEDAVADAEAELLSAAGHDVDRLIVANPTNPVAAAGKLAIVAWNPSAIRVVQERIAAFEPDVAHVHNTWYSLSTSALTALRKSGVPSVMTLHNYRYTCLNGQLLRDGRVCELCVGASTVRGIGYRCYRNSLPSSAMATIGAAAAHRSWSRDVDRFIVMTEFARGVFTQAGLPADRLTVKPHHVADPGRRQTKPSQSRTVLFVGRLAPEKGIDVLVEAWRRAELAGYGLVVVGDGPLRDGLAATAPASVRFAGWLPAEEVRALMLGARLLAFPSIWYETFGLAMVEALAAGTPVLASALGGTPELLGAAQTDRLVAPGDVTAWTAGLRKFVPDDVWIDDAGRQSRTRYEDQFTAERALRNLEHTYQSVVSAAR